MKIIKIDKCIQCNNYYELQKLCVLLNKDIENENLIDKDCPLEDYYVNVIVKSIRE